jgi:hypothetical protein
MILLCLSKSTLQLRRRCSLDILLFFSSDGHLLKQIRLILATLEKDCQIIISVGCFFGFMMHKLSIGHMEPKQEI